VVDAPKRLTGDEILEHSWVANSMTPKNHLKGAYKNFQEFSSKKGFKKAALTVMAMNRFKHPK
jgi:hypothetical protein